MLTETQCWILSVIKDNPCSDVYLFCQTRIGPKIIKMLPGVMYKRDKDRYYTFVLPVDYDNRVFYRNMGYKDSMKLCFVDKPTRSILDAVHLDTEKVVITRINVPNPADRGKGIGSKLLTDFLKEADKHEMEVRLEVSPYPGISFKRLVHWYKTFGFIVEESSIVMRRPKRESNSNS